MPSQKGFPTPRKTWGAQDVEVPQPVDLAGRAPAQLEYEVVGFVQHMDARCDRELSTGVFSR